MEVFLIIIQVIVVLFLGSITTTLFIVGIKIFCADKSVYQANFKATGNPLKAIKGTLPTFRRDGRRDHTVCAGLGYDLKEHRLVEQGTLSDESVENILR